MDNKTSIKIENSAIDLDKYRAENEIKINNIDELNAGDHIIIVFNEKNYFHAILHSIQQLIENENKIALLEITFYNSEKITDELKDYIVNNLYKAKDEEEEKTSYVQLQYSLGVIEAKLIYKKDKFDIYRVVYDEKVEACLSSNKTLDKAKSLIGESKYNVFENNDEHFAIYCKTGKAGKLFLLESSHIDSQEIFGTTISEKVKGTIKGTGTHMLLVNIAQHVASRFPRSVIAASLPYVVKNATPLIGIGMETFSVGSDIHNMYLNNIQGKINNLRLKKYIAKRIGRSTGGLAGGAVGGIVGQVFIPIPVFGAVVGGFVGGLLGSAAGYMQGLLIGDVFEMVDNSWNKYITNKPSEQQKYDVLDNIVLKFEDSFVIVDKKEKELHNKSIETENKDEIDDIDSFEMINHEDYDIYVLDDDNKGSVEINNEIKKDSCQTSVEEKKINNDNLNVVLGVPKVEADETFE